MTTNFTEELLALLRGAIADLGGSPPQPSSPANLDDYLLSLLRTLLERLPPLINPSLDSDLVAIAEQGTTPYGRSLLLLADVLALRSALGLGALAYQNLVSQGFIADNAILANNLLDGAITTAKLAPAAVTFAKFQTLSNQSLVGNNSGGPASPSEIPFSVTGLSLLQAADAAAARSAIGAVDNTHQNQTVGPSLHGLGANVRVLGNRNASGEFIQRGTVTGQSASVSSFTPSVVQQIAVTFPAAFSSPPRVFVNCDFRPAAAISITVTGFTVLVFDDVANSDRTVHYLAIGS